MVKFASVSATARLLTLLLVTILLGAEGLGQSAPAPAPAPDAAAQQPAATPPAAASGQEPADEESTSRRVKPHDYKNWSYNVGAGANLDSGETRDWVRQGGFAAAGGVARNANKYLGLRADFIFANLPLRDSTQQLAQATGATSRVYSFAINPIINLPVTKLYGGYVTFGPAFSHREGSLSGDTALPGSGCNGFWTWWGACTNSNFSIPVNGNFVNSNVNQFGYDFGGGVTRKMPSGVEIYAEYRIMHSSRNGITTDYHPITIGFRW